MKLDFWSGYRQVMTTVFLQKQHPLLYVLSMDPAGSDKPSQAGVSPKLLVSFQPFNFGVPVVGLCPVTDSKAVLVQGLLLNLSPCC